MKISEGEHLLVYAVEVKNEYPEDEDDDVYYDVSKRSQVDVFGYYKENGSTQALHYCGKGILNGKEVKMYYPDDSNNCYYGEYVFIRKEEK
jgi:hypothetical protein